ncbi:MAG: SpoIIE family protein phosphatase, partial [Oscillospiraceae bacterium]|nr:SpoIIE family protein phosphatase [Oscillospiraceae bacterium]
ELPVTAGIGPLTFAQQVSVIVVAAVGLVSLTGFEWSGISPGRIAAGAVIMLLARSGREQGGCIAGVTIGVALAMTSPEHSYLAVAYAFGGLVAGLFSRFGRVASAAAFLAANVIIIISTGTDLTVVAGIYEMLAAGVIFIILPSALDRRINGFFLRGAEQPAVEGLRRNVVMRLKFAAKAMDEVAGVVDQVSRRLTNLNTPDLGGIYRAASEAVCYDCPKRALCWEIALSDTMDAFNNLSGILRAEGKITRIDISGHLARQCENLDDLIRRINHGYTGYLAQESGMRRIAELRVVAADQFSNTAGLLEELAEEFSSAERVDEEAAARVRQVCAQHELPAGEVICLIGKNGRMTVEIVTGTAQRPRLDETEWRRQVEDACGRSFGKPAVNRLEDDGRRQSAGRITLRERPNYKVSVGKAQKSCSGEKLCGDAVEVFTDHGGRTTAVLADGMGCGGRAAVDGAMTAALTVRLFQAGFSADAVLRMVNAAFLVKSGDESLSTLDVIAVDLFGGRIESLKAGAALSLLYSGGRISRIDRSSLPVGILRDIRFERYTDVLADGDLVLMMSDGVIVNGTGWVEERLAKYDPDKQNLDELAEEIVTIARKQQQREDDVTAVVMRVERIGACER